MRSAMWEVNHTYKMEPIKHSVLKAMVSFPGCQQACQHIVTRPYLGSTIIHDSIGEEQLEALCLEVSCTL